jgi:hypothetical protein
VEFENLLPVLVRGGVDFILVGGVAGIVHGSARLTYDVAEPGEAGQFLQQKSHIAGRAEANGRSWATQLIDPIGCPLGGVRVDLVYSRADANIEHLANALAPHAPYLRDAPSGLPFSWDARTIRSGLNFTLTTDLGHLDLFGELIGGGSYEDLLPHSFDVEAFDVRFKCLDLPTLIRIKEAAGRTKDHEAIAELRVLLEEREKKQ